MADITLSVPEISCDHCKTSIEGAVGALDNVASVNVSIEDRTVDIAFVGAPDLADVTAAIEEQGYDIAD